jgi:hypothetical protein
MAVQNLVEQHISFRSSDGMIDQYTILSNTLIQSLFANALGNDLIQSLKQYSHFSNGVLAQSWEYELQGYFQPAFQATIQTNIPNLQAALPQYAIVTWGINVAFGN